VDEKRGVFTEDEQAMRH